MINIYAKFAEEHMAMPVIKGTKSESERFAGADETYTIEAMMQDGKALQSGTSHFLGQNFAKAFDVKFVDQTGKQDFVWATSWGVSTRLMGALIMTHSDDFGLVLPPKLAPIHVAIVPIYKNEEDLVKIEEKLNPIINALKEKNISVKFDYDDKKRPGWKFAEYEAKGVPVRYAIGLRDLDNNQIEVARRDTREKNSIPLNEVVKYTEDLLKEIQENLFTKATAYRQEQTQEIDDYEVFKKKIETEPGFFLAHWDGTIETEEKIQQETKATIRCIPLDGKEEQGKCMVTGKPSKRRVIFAKAY